MAAAMAALAAAAAAAAAAVGVAIAAAPEMNKMHAWREQARAGAPQSLGFQFRIMNGLPEGCSKFLN